MCTFTHLSFQYPIEKVVILFHTGDLETLTVGFLDLKRLSYLIMQFYRLTILYFKHFVLHFPEACVVFVFKNCCFSLICIYIYVQDSRFLDFCVVIVDNIP